LTARKGFRDTNDTPTRIYRIEGLYFRVNNFEGLYEHDVWFMGSI